MEQHFKCWTTRPQDIPQIIDFDLDRELIEGSIDDIAEEYIQSFPLDGETEFTVSVREVNDKGEFIGDEQKVFVERWVKITYNSTIL